MARPRFPNLTVLTEAAVNITDRSSLTNALIAKVPSAVADTVDHYSLADAIRQEFQVDICIEDTSRYGLDYFMQLQSWDAKTRMLNRGFVVVNNFTVLLIPWTPNYGSTAVPLQTLLNSQPINQHLHSYPPLLARSEHLTINIYGIPPHLCCEPTIYQLFDKIATIRAIRFIPATLSYEITAYGQLHLVPDVAHIGLRRPADHRDLVNIWPLIYETYTDEMLGRLTPPGDRSSECGGTHHCNLNMLYRLNHPSS
jgi:hypothetical protein